MGVGARGALHRPLGVVGAGSVVLRAHLGQSELGFVLCNHLGRRTAPAYWRIPPGGWCAKLGGGWLAVERRRRLAAGGVFFVEGVFRGTNGTLIRHFNSLGLALLDLDCLKGGKRCRVVH